MSWNRLLIRTNANVMAYQIIRDITYLRLNYFFRNLNRAPLLKRVCLYSFCFGSALAILVVLAQSVWRYQSQRVEILQCIEAAVEQRFDALSEMVWGKDETQISKILLRMQSACRSPEFTSSDNHRLPPMFLSVDMNSGRRIQVGSSLAKEAIKLSYPISYSNEMGAQAYWLGELHVTQSLSAVHQAIRQDAFSTLFIYLFLIACSTFMAAAFGYQMVIRRVRRFMTALQAPEVSESIRHEVEDDRSEVSRLWVAIINLRDNLESKYLLATEQTRKLQKERDEVHKASDAKSQFLAKMSHELRTPMNGLLGFSALLLETKLDSEQREYAQTIQLSLESLLHVVNDVLDLSRIETGDLHVTTIPFSLRGVISGVSSLLKTRAESKGLAFESRISPEIPQLLRGDPVRIRQILMNLVSNAIQHTNKGRVLINVEQVSSGEGEVTLCIAIEDTGSGPDQRRKPQSDPSVPCVTSFSSDFRERRSLGLDVCYQLAELMNATIAYESTSGAGSTFWLEICLPVVKSSQIKASIDFSLTKDLNVLVIDSYELSRKITLELLQEWGVKFEAVSSAAEAISTLSRDSTEQGRFNMVLCDDLLQDLAGIDACKRIRAITPTQMCIVILCSNPQLGDAEGFYLSGANGFLSKPQRDPYLRSVMCQVYAERELGNEHGRHLVTRYTVSDADNEESEFSHLNINKKGRVLVVEDNIVNQQLAAKLLEKKGCQVDLAANGFEAIELFKANDYALIFMDCLMPDMDGYETTQIIRAFEKSGAVGKRIPIIALTAHAIEGEADRCFQVGMDEFITKPFKLTQLEMVLERYIN